MIYLGSTPEILAQAALAARRGEAARILEPSSRLGGWAASEEIWPEVEVSLAAHHAGGLSQRLIDDLQLVEEHGLAFLNPTALAHAPAPDENTPSLTIWREMDRSVEEIRRHSRQDASRWPDFCRRMHRYAGLLDELLYLDLARLLQQGLDTFGPGAGAAAYGSGLLSKASSRTGQASATRPAWRSSPSSRARPSTGRRVDSRARVDASASAAPPASAALSAHEGGRFSETILILAKTLLTRSSWTHLPPLLRFAARLRGQGGPEMMEFLRVLPMTFKELMDEWFETPLLRGLLGSTAVLNSHLGPQAAGTTLNFLYHLIDSPDGQFRNVRRVRGGLPALVQTLESAARSASVEITLNADIRSYFEAGLASDSPAPSNALNSNASSSKASNSPTEGSEDSAAEQFRSNPRIAPPQSEGTGRSLGRQTRPNSTLGKRESSDVDNGWISAYTPHHTYLSLLPPSHITPRLLRRLRPQAPRPVTTYLHVLLKDPTPPTDAESGHIIIAPSLEYIERASDAPKYERSAERPVIDAFRTHDKVLTPRLQYSHPGLKTSHFDLRTSNFPLDSTQIADTRTHPDPAVHAHQSLDLDQLLQRAFRSIMEH